MATTVNGHEVTNLLPSAGPDPRPVREIVRSLEPIAWSYLRLSPEGLDERALQVRHVLDVLARDGAGEPVLRAVQARLTDTPVAPLQLALFVDRDGTILHEQLLPEDGPHDRAGCSAPADVLPLLAHDQDRPPFVSVVIDRSGADLVYGRGGGAPDRHERVVGSDDVIEQNAPGGWASLSQSRFQRRAVDSWQHNAREVARRVRLLAEAVHAQTIVIAGDDPAVKLFLDRLAVEPGTLIQHVAGSRTAMGSPHDQQEWLAHALRDVAATQSERLMAAFHEHLGDHGRAVEGVRDSMAALAVGRVAVLFIVAPALRRPIWFGERATDVFAEHDEAVLAGVPVRRARLADAAVRSALRSGGRVRLVPPGVGSPAEGIGALCRFGM